MPKIKVELSEQSIADAIKQIKAYKKTLNAKLAELRNRVAEELQNEVKIGFNGALYDDVIHEGMKVPDVEVGIDERGNLTFVVAEGEQAVFAEFGAGVYYNADGGRPDRPAGIVQIGEYGKGYGKRKIWGYYDESGELKLTHGTPASMPMYYAVRKIAQIVPDIAKEVFKEG